MDTTILDAELNKEIEDFALMAKSLFPEGSKEPVVESDLAELAKQTYYLFHEFRKIIVKHINQI